MKLSELEIKIKIDSEKQAQSILEACQQLCAHKAIPVLQLDEYYDTQDGQLRKQDLVIRIRSFGEKKTIALKSPRVELSSGMTERIELEFLAADGEKVHAQLLSQGLKPYQAAEKERWTFVYKECEIVLDKLPFIGYFVEVEGPSESAIKEVTHLLGLSSSPVITKHYGELMTDKFRELNLPQTYQWATFDKEKEFQRSG